MVGSIDTRLIVLRGNSGGVAGAAAGVVPAPRSAGGRGETVIGPARWLDETVKMIIDGGFAEPPVLARSNPATWLT